MPEPIELENFLDAHKSDAKDNVNCTRSAFVYKSSLLFLPVSIVDAIVAQPNTKIVK